jgi:uncharacterized membrane protein HdeD (DUF308 family)
VFQRSIRSWWLLALCGVLDAAIAVIYLIGQNTGWTFHVWHGTVVLLGKLTLAAGVCTIAAGIWNFRNTRFWLLVLNGLACSALGSIFAFWTGPLAFRTVALFMVVMALSIGGYEFATARKLRGLGEEWLLGAAGVASMAFALAFLGFVFGWIKLQPGSPAQSLHWLGSYFGFSAICMLLLTLRWDRSSLSPSSHR